MIKIAIVLLLSSNCFTCLAQMTKSKINKSAWVNKILECYKKKEIFEYKYEKRNSDNYVDSINKYNYALSSLLSSSYVRKLSYPELRTIAKKTTLKLIISKDLNLRILSWKAFEFSPTQMCSNLMLFADKSKLISLNGAGDQDFGENIQFNKIIDLKIKNKTYYLVIGANQCGNLCIQKLATIYSIVKDDLIKCTRTFFDGNVYSDKIEFNYLINDKLKNEPIFRVNNLELLTPIFNEYKTQILGTKKYQISVCDKS